MGPLLCQPGVRWGEGGVMGGLEEQGQSVLGCTDSTVLGRARS